MMSSMAQKDTRTYAERKAAGQDFEEYRRMPRRAVPAPAELWELIERTVDPGGELNPEEPKEKRELGQRVNEWVRRRMADGVGRPDLAQVEE